MGQELSPRHASTISSLLMGGAWGVGALLIGPIGVLGDHIGLRGALTVLASLGFVGLACAMALPAHTHLASRPVDLAAPTTPAEVSAAADAPLAPAPEPALGVRSGGPAAER
jgi:FSR family fosmidomycin resistance protein-like MFS transporter